VARRCRRNNHWRLKRPVELEVERAVDEWLGFDGLKRCLACGADLRLLSEDEQTSVTCCPNCGRVVLFWWC